MVSLDFASSVSPTVNINVIGSALTSTRLSLVVPSTARVGKQIRVYGVLSTTAGPVINANVTITLSSGEKIYPPVTDTKGYFTINYRVNRVGTLTFQAHFAGMPNLSASASPIKTVKVRN